ncbi:hypothetical protein Q7P37_011150 [Cladosporium fusiforme]
MSSYPPSTGQYQPSHPAPSRPESNRARTNSSIADKYRPRIYSDAPPTQPDPSLLGPHQQPYHQRQQSYPQQETYTPTQDPSPIPQAEHIYPNQALGASSRHSSYTHTRPPMDDDHGRRPSYSSQHSRHSYESRHSHDSRMSRDSKRSRHSKHSVVDDRHERKSHGGKEKKLEHPKRINERPTMVDSLFSMFDLFKSALGPRDK